MFSSFEMLLAQHVKREIGPYTRSSLLTQESFLLSWRSELIETPLLTLQPDMNACGGMLGSKIQFSRSQAMLGKN